MTKIKTNHWYKITKLNLAVAARKAGFDLAIFDYYTPAVKREVRKHSISQIMSDLHDRVLEEHSVDLQSFKSAVYVISLAYPLTIKYPLGQSHVLYIGIGNASGRIESHFKKKLFEFMQSLSGAEFNIQVAIPRRAGSVLYFKHIEYLMLKYFADYYGGADKALPLLNKNRGSNKNLSPDSKWWASAVKKVGKKPIWTLNPTDIPSTWVLD